MTVEIVILAMIAAFLALRLYSVLGRRAEHGEEPVQPRLDAHPASAAARLPERAPAPQPQPGVVRPRDLPAVPAVAERGLREIAGADRRFDPALFLEGARAAYRMILEAFWQGKREEIAHLCDRAVADSFLAAVADRQAAGEVVDNRLVRINEAQIVGAGYAAPVARVTVRFVADIAAVTRDASGHVVAGSLDDAVEVTDVWTFARDLTSSDPDWLLEETDEG